MAEVPSIPLTTPADAPLSRSRNEFFTHSSADGSRMTLCICCSETSQPHICTCDFDFTCECFGEKKPRCICEETVCTCEGVPREVCICELHSGKTTEKIRHVCDTCICAEEYTAEEEEGEEPCMSSRFRDVLDLENRVQVYLRKRRVLELVDFMVRHLLANTPKNPIPFLIELLDACMYFRAGLKEPPLLFGERHIQAILESFDPTNTGFLTVGQYRRAFQAVGLCNYPQPASARVSAALFSSAARQLLTGHLAAALNTEPKDESPSCVCDDKCCAYLCNCPPNPPNVN